MGRIARIEALLTAAFRPTLLEVIDESHQHAGHGGWRAGEVTHVRVRITSPAFAGLGRVAQHRAVNTALQPVIDEGLHALAIETRAG